MECLLATTISPKRSWTSPSTTTSSTAWGATRRATTNENPRSSEEEIRTAGAKTEIIEEYPEDKYSPSVLMLGFTSAGRPLHIQVSSADSDETRIITLYEPDPSEWAEFRKRR